MNRKLDKLENLLASKSYQDLTAEEKEWIDQQYTASDYDAMRMTFTEGRKIFRKDQTKPNPEIQSRLRQKLRQSKKPAKVTPLFAYRIPAWQAIAAFALLLFFIPQIQSKHSGDPEQVFIYQIDTVFKEIPIETILSPIIDTLADIPSVRKIINRTNRSPIKASTVVFSNNSELSGNLSKNVAESFASSYDTVSVENIISQYLKDSVKSIRVEIDSGFQNLGRIY